LRSLREILKISSRLKSDEVDAEEGAIIHHAFISFFETQLTPKVNLLHAFMFILSYNLTDSI
jgi:hypothetical protein